MPTFDIYGNLVVDAIFTNKAFELQQVSTGFVYSQLKKLRINKATGLDCIPPRLLSDEAGAIPGCLTHIINLTFTTGVVDEWKTATIVHSSRRERKKLLHKLRRELCTTNYINN